MTTLRSLRTASLLALIASLPAFGAAYVGSAYEGFDYTAGAMTAVLNGGTGWNAAGDNSPNTASWGVGTGLVISNSGATIQSPSLANSTPGYPASTGASTLVNGSASSSSIGRQFGQSVDTGTFYFSFLTQKTNTELRTVNLSFFGTNERLAIGQIANNLNTRDPDGNWPSGAGANSGNFAALISNSQNNTTAAATAGPAANGVYVKTTDPVAYPSSTVALVVVKIEFNVAGGATVEDRLTLYVNPTNLTTENIAEAYLVIDHNDFGALTGFRIFSGLTASGFTTAPGIFDEIRVGSSYAAVTTGVSVPPVTPLQEWRDVHFTPSEQGQPAVSGLEADPDVDGRSNLLEYALGSLPRSSDVTPGPVARSATGVLALDYPKLRDDVTYVVETSTDFASWDTVGITDAPTGGEAPAHMRTATVPLPVGGRVFLRLRVTKTE